MKGVTGSTPGHGTLARYNTLACRCDLCRRAKARHQVACQLRQLRGISAWTTRHGTIRRIQALRRMGWSAAHIGAWLDRTEQAVTDLTKRPDSLILTATAARVAAVYDRWCMTPGPSVLARRHAQRMGWHPPLAWDDETIDDPAATPQGAAGPNTTNVRVDDERIADLTAQGMSAALIADVLGCSKRAVVRSRARARRQEVAA